MCNLCKTIFFCVILYFSYQINSSIHLVSGVILFFLPATEQNKLTVAVSLKVRVLEELCNN